ncbi:MAG: glycosyltransferase family 39 protein [Albidovulum sp.]|nr:glycosyltransferase family 39 protein [Albidovulum sp.]
MFDMTCAVIFTWLPGTRLFGIRAGIVAALLLAGSLIAGFEARQAKTDAVLLAAVVAAQNLVAKIYLNWLPGERVAPLLSYLFWLAIAFGVLVKAPIIILVSGANVIVLMIWNRSWGLFRRLRPVTGLLPASSIALPWFLAVASLSGGEFFEEAVGRDLFGKVFWSQESRGFPRATNWPFSGLLLGAGQFLRGCQSDGFGEIAPMDQLGFALLG